MERVLFAYGDQITPAAMKPWHVYLDGACQGPAVRTDLPAVSFDHHANCVRTFTLATCQQVLLALELGFDPAAYTVVINDLDADTSLSVWLLLRRPDLDHPGAPPRWSEPKVRDLVQQVGFVDAHGPVKRSHPLHRALSLPPGQPQSLADLEEHLRILDLWFYDGTVPETKDWPPAPWRGLTIRGETVEGEGDFAVAYAAGAVVALALVPGPKDTIGYTIGKVSEFVRFDVPGFLATMNRMESGWGGGSTIGGAPRHSDYARSRLPVETVWEGVVATFVGKPL